MSLSLTLEVFKESWLNMTGMKRKFQSDKRIDGQVVVITGANSGIGKETVIDLSSRGAKVIMGCRDMKKAQVVIDEIKKINSRTNLIAIKLDLSSLRSVREFAKSIGEQESQIDILINNAGIHGNPESITEEGFEMIFGTNHLGPFLLTLLLLPQLRRSPKARVVSVSSNMYKIAKINFENINLRNGEYSYTKAYNQSKLANTLFIRELAKRLGDQSTVTAYSLHPGVIKTDILRSVSPAIRKTVNIIGAVVMMTPKMGCQTTLYCALEDSLDNESGFHYANCRREEVLSNARDDRTAERLWELSSDLVKLEDHLKLSSDKHKRLALY